MSKDLIENQLLELLNKKNHFNNSGKGGENKAEDHKNGHGCFKDSLKQGKEKHTRSLSGWQIHFFGEKSKKSDFIRTTIK